MKLFKLNGISKKYALRAAHYRRVAKGQAVAGLAFTEDALSELYGAFGRDTVQSFAAYVRGMKK